MDIRDEQHVGKHVYGINAKTQAAEERMPASVAVEFTGADADGQVIAEGNLLISLDALVDTTAFVEQTLDGIAALHGQRTRNRSGSRSRGRAPNAGQRWDQASAEQLWQRWMGSSPPTTAYELTGDLAEHFGRSRSAIRAQLARLGCDPDVPGRPLAHAAVEETPANGGALTVGEWEFYRE